MSKLIYMDNAATTAVKPEVFEKMKPYFMENYSNPSSVYSFAGEAKKAVDDARDIIAGALNAKAAEIYFTGGGSEADNWAIKATAEAYKNKGKHIITSAIEHHAVLHTCGWLERHGYEVTYLPVDENGTVSPEKVEEAIRPDTILISIMFANNEIGTIEPIKEIGEIAEKHGVLFHTDAVQAFGHVPIDVQEMHIDMLSASGHKFHGPKGIGFMYMRNGLKLGSFIHGGAQERSRRAGTHNVPGIVGMGEAARIAMEQLEANAVKETEVRDYLIARVEKEIPYIKVNGHRENRLPNNINICFRFKVANVLCSVRNSSDVHIATDNRRSGRADNRDTSALYYRHRLFRSVLTALVLIKIVKRGFCFTSRNSYELISCKSCGNRNYTAAFVCHNRRAESDVDICVIRSGYSYEIRLSCEITGKAVIK